MTPTELKELLARLRAVRGLPTKCPTIAELEAILAEPDPPPIEILPDGSVTANKLVNPDGPKAADTIEGLESRVEVLEKMRAGYVSQMQFCDIEPLPYFREFVRKIDAALAKHKEQMK